MLDHCLSCVPTCIDDEMNESLVAKVTEAEVKSAVFSMGASKASGLDGFNGLFYQKNWDTIKVEVYNAVVNFFENGVLDESINLTSVALVPKVPNPESIVDLRPLSCCSYLVKIISKIMAMRLKPIMSKIISPQQSAFALLWRG